MSKDEGLVKTAHRMEAIRKILTNGIWIAIVVVVLASIGRYLVMKDASQISQTAPREKPIVASIPWHEVDQAIATAITDTRRSTEDFASKQIDKWITELMERVDNDFLDWYFGYWTQQVLGLKGLGQYGVHYFIETQPTAAEKITEEIQEQFAKRVLRPQIAELRLERIVRDTANYYTVELRKNLVTVPEKYKIPHNEWDRYLEGIAITTYSTDGNREVPVTLKTLVASGAGGAVLLAGNMKILIGKLSSKVMAKSSTKVAAKLAAKTGGKVAAKAGGKFLGTIVGVGILIWDVWDHYKTKKENKPILRKAFSDYFVELKDILLNDPEAGLMTTFNDLEKQVFASLNSSKGQPTK